jgi:isoleucyl-tRNA synthetase
MTVAKEEAQVYPKYSQPDYPAFEERIRQFWAEQQIFERSVEEKEGNETFTFFEGPPSANGFPGIHHVMARAIKDIFCRYKTMQGYQVRRKAGWDTHGLPIELQVENTLGITKKDIGSKISIAEYNAHCRRDVMQYKDRWDELTRLMGFWIDLDDPYITFHNNYIESVWQLLRRLYDKGLLYKGYTIQPYSPKAGTGLSSHELNQPGCYQLIKDTSVTAEFKLADAEDEYLLAWTTTPWTLPANAALAVGDNIAYVKVATLNPYTGERQQVILAEDLLPTYFNSEQQDQPFEAFQPGGKQKVPWHIAARLRGKDLVGRPYEPVMPFDNVQLTGAPADNAFHVISGDFVTTDEGTGIVHIAPTFGADDQRVAQQQGIPAVTVKGPEGEDMPIVDAQGRFVEQVAEFGGRYVRPEYNEDSGNGQAAQDVNLDIAVKLKKEGRAFKVEKYEHNYPHCWRTDKPILYYPLDSWFVNTSAYRERLVELNRTINWKPEGTGTGRFGNWLANLVDWNLSRSRYWGTPLPIWRNEEGTEEHCIGSIAELHEAAERAVQAGLMAENPVAQDDFDLHRPYVDEVILADSQGRPMYRETHLIDVWFDSGAMPFAQWHYPFENTETFRKNFPADFIAEGVDQTRGWFFTLHAIAVLLEDNVAFRNVIANGLVLDKNGDKMSKRKGNVIDPFDTMYEYGADPTRWYMIANAPPWENLRFNLAHLAENRRKFFGTLFYTYDFFALYANIDGFRFAEQQQVPVAERPELDRWVLSKLYSTQREVEAAFDDFDPTRATRAVQDFVIEQLSNWYVRLARRRFWRGELTPDKQAAYETLFECLLVTAQLMAPVAPFFAEWLYHNLTSTLREQGLASSQRLQPVSIHLTEYAPVADQQIDQELLEQMALAQQLSSLGRSLRKRAKIRLRQPLQRVSVPALDAQMQRRLQRIEDLVQAELNVKELEIVTDESGGIVKKIKPNFKVLGPRLGKAMKTVAQAIESMDQTAIQQLEQKGEYTLTYGEGEQVTLTPDDVEISAEDLPGRVVETEGGLTVALDTELTEALEREGLAREFINRIQNLRKEQGFEVTDTIDLHIAAPAAWQTMLKQFQSYICNETLAASFALYHELSSGQAVSIHDQTATILIEKHHG